MRKKLYIIFCFCLVCVSLTACKKSPVSPANSNYHVTLKINGALYNLTSVSGQLLSNGTSIHARDSISGKQLLLNLYPSSVPIRPNTEFTSRSNAQDVHDNSLYLAVNDGSATIDSYTDNGGQITATVINITATTLQGTFSGKLADQSSGQVYTVTEGDFFAPINSQQN